MSRWAKAKGDDTTPDVYPTVIEGLKKLYKSKLKGVEEQYKFGEFHTPILTDSDFDAKPQVLLIGQYSTGKTSFIRYLLERDFPGQRIGPEPTTDRFVAVMHGVDERVIPGNALAVNVDKPFSALQKFGTSFLSKFEASQCPAPILENITLIDTPGVLSGEKQRIGRAYDFVQVCEHFAIRADLILLLFDAHKLDISDEFKRAIEALKGHDDKIRVVLNKADMVDTQQLMRVYGALMWSLGKVIQTPEVMRVYIGSFWDKPYHIKENEELFKKEQADLFRDLRYLPKNSAIRKINELVKRARMAKVHALIISHLRAQMPMMFGKESKQKELLENLELEFAKVQQQYRIPKGDFPDVHRFRAVAATYNFKEFSKLNMRAIESMEAVLARDIPKLMKQFPQDGDDSYENLEGMQHLLTSMKNEEPAPAPSAVPAGSNSPFARPAGAGGSNPFGAAGGAKWDVSTEDKEKYDMLFAGLQPQGGQASGDNIKPLLIESGLAFDLLGKIWDLADMEKNGYLDSEEFAVAMHLINKALAGAPVPDTIPPTLMPPSRR